ncbi:MAG: ABC transporter ATP-binding protein [Clostridia bacterium]|nr:ABC transporter ATP-binding protein [Clostridia bacterium]
MLKLIKYLKHCKRYAVTAMLLVCIQNLITLALPTVVSKILDNGVDKGDSAFVTWMGLVMCVVAGIGCVVGILGNYFSAKTSANFGASLRKSLFIKITDLSAKEHEQFGTASLITRTTNDIQHLQELVLGMLKLLIPAPVLFIGGAILSFMYNPKIAAVVLLIVPVIGIAVYFIFKVTKKLFDRQRKKVDIINRIVREKLTGIRVIRAFNREASEDEKFQESNLDLMKISLKINRMFAVVIPVALFMLYTILALIMIFGAKDIDNLTDPVALSASVYDLQMFMIFILLMISGIGMASAIFVMIPAGEVAAKRINAVLECEVSVSESEEPVHFAQGGDAHLEFKDVKFCYPDAEEPVLQKINFECRAGEITAIIGPTGAGKSTLVNLIPRFFDVISGEVLLDGVNIKDVPLKELRERIGLIPQKTFLFSGTIADNLRYGNAAAEEEDMWEALNVAQAEEFVRLKPEQLEAFVSQGGKNFSGGQKQRLSIARALMKKAEIYIFDDSFSALDFKTDAALRAALRDKFKYANILIVAQRINTVMDADRIIVLDEGQIAGIGTHKELMETCEAYQEIALSQISTEEVSKLG